MLYQWHLDDPVDPSEVTRNNRTGGARRPQSARRPPRVGLRCVVLGATGHRLGCMATTACNFDPAANEDDGICVFVGDACNDGNAMTFDDVYTDCSLPGYGCEGTPVTVPGCTSGSACNFDPAATENDGSCLFEGDPCDDGDATTFNDVYTDCDASNYGCGSHRR